MYNFHFIPTKKRPEHELEFLISFLSNLETTFIYQRWLCTKKGKVLKKKKPKWIKQVKECRCLIYTARVCNSLGHPAPFAAGAREQAEAGRPGKPHLRKQEGTSLRLARLESWFLKIVVLRVSKVSISLSFSPVPVCLCVSFVSLCHRYLMSLQ